MAKIDTYSAITGAALADGDLLMAWDISSSGEKFKNITVAEFGNKFAKLDEATVTFGGTVVANLFSGPGTSLTFGSGFNPTFGVVTATTYFGNGSQMSGITGASGGVDNDNDLNLVADKIDDGTGKITLSIGPTDVLQVTNDSKVHVLTEMGSDVNVGGFELINSKTILDQQIGPYYNFNGISGDIRVSDNSSFSELFANGGAYICKFNAFSSGEGDGGRFFTKGSFLLNLTLGEVLFVADFTTTNGIWEATGFPVTFNKDSILVVSYDGSSTANNPTLYIGGVEITLVRTSIPDGVLNSDVGDLIIGNNPDSRTFEGNIYSSIFLNRELTASESKSFSSNTQKSLDWVDKGGSNVAQNVSTMVNNNYDSTANETANGIDAVKTTTGTGQFECGSVDEIVLVAGKQYLLTFTEVLASGVAPTVDLKASLGGATATVEGGQVSAAGANSFVFTALTSQTVVIQFASLNADVSNYQMTLIDVHQLGATLVLDGKDFGHITANDSSGNSNDGVVTGVELVNQPEFVEYTDRYKTFATDNNTFDVPPGTVELQIIIDVITQEAATTLRIGISDGGQEVVADVVTTSTGLIVATMVLDNFRSGDQLFIGQDGGAAWSALDFNLYINYKVLENLT